MIEDKKQKEVVFHQCMETIETMDQLQREAIQAYDEGMTYLALAKFQSENNSLSLNPNLLGISPAFKKLDGFKLVSSERKEYSLVPQFSAQPKWTELSEEEYAHETALSLDQQNQKCQDIIEHLGLSQDQAVIRVRDEFTKSLVKYLEIAKNLVEIQQHQQ